VEGSRSEMMGSAVVGRMRRSRASESVVDAPIHLRAWISTITIGCCCAAKAEIRMSSCFNISRDSEVTVQCVACECYEIKFFDFNPTSTLLNTLIDHPTKHSEPQ